MTDVFISYSRRDLEFAQTLDAALTAKGKVTWFDQKTEPLVGILPGEKWWEQIKGGIEAADNFLFVISPASMASSYCNAEIAHALAQEKRIVTVLYHGDESEVETLRSIDQAIDTISPDDELPLSASATVTNLRSLTRRNWLAISQIQYVAFSVNGVFDQALNLLIRALDTDLAWIKKWGQLQQAAQIWSETSDDSHLWSEMRLKPVREEIKKHGQKLAKVEREFLKPEQERLLEEIEDIETPHQRRDTIGNRLAVIGDLRPGVGLRSDGLPDIVWCAVPSGKIWLTDKKDEKIDTFIIRSFHIAKYPITYKQFQAFLDDPEGHCNRTWWEGFPEKHQMQAMEEQDYKFDNYPRDSVSWYQAVAFCRWLNTKLPEAAWPEPLEQRPERTRVVGHLFGRGQRTFSCEIRLPTEWEWQQAATGGNSENKYPWGSEWDSRRANTEEAGLARATAVGMYPQGASPVGALDMCGNIAEWCMNENHHPKNLGLGSSIVPVITFEHKEGERVARGSAFSSSRELSRCSFRESLQPHFSFQGFRVCYGTMPI